ncbi:hypothetical protein EDD85DRAFT_735887, partial [Armillaria nabsnona]
LMKTRWPEHYLPHPATVSCVMKTVFAKTHNCISQDSSALPNHQAYVAVTVHFAHEDGIPVSMILDFIEIP